jgi:O-succinylbenzoate synthase
MMQKIKAFFKKHTLVFKKPARTSRDTLLKKPTYYLILRDLENGVFGVGECSTIKGLSIDNEDTFEAKLQELCAMIDFNNGFDFEVDLEDFPAIRFGYETAMLDLMNGGKRQIFINEFYEGKKDIPINGLVWMDDAEEMSAQIKEKIEQGYGCVKLKIGALDFEEELSLLKSIRKNYKKADIEIRVDANGAFEFEKASEVLKQLAELDIHSIEQPIKPDQWEQMAELCSENILPVALDEELIGVDAEESRLRLIQTIKPHYLILKPSLLGGVYSCVNWIELAETENIGWWATSALESNIGLNAIAQWVANYDNNMYQGLGTGQLYKNNIKSPLEITVGNLAYNSNTPWNLKMISGL